RAVLLGHQLEHPLLGLVARQGGVEVAIDPAEPGEEANRRARVTRLPERRLDHLLQIGLVDPERLAVTDDGLRIGRIVVPAHAVRPLEGDLALALERAGQRLRLDDLAEVGLHGPGLVVALLEARQRVLQRVGAGGSRRSERGQDDGEKAPHERTAIAPPPAAQARFSSSPRDLRGVALPGTGNTLRYLYCLRCKSV